MDARVKLSAETLKSLNQELSPIERGRIRLKRLQEIADSGLLDRCTNRLEVANAMGFPQEQAMTGYNWITGQIRSHKLSETFRGFENGKLIYEYHVLQTYIKPHKTFKKNDDKKEVVKIVENKPEIKEEVKVNNIGIRCIITINNISIDMINLPASDMLSLIMKIIEKE